jgi:hypothetical protein
MALSDLPDDPSERDEFALRLMGSPDPVQIDGLGGTYSSTSKIVAVESRSRGSAIEIAYLFAQVGVDRPVVDWAGNCGNLTAAVGPYAIYEGLVLAADAVAEIELFNLNTNRRVTAYVPTEHGRPAVAGEFAIAGVPGTAAQIKLEWHDPGGSVNGDVLPTGSPLNEFSTSWGKVPVSVVDVSGPYVFVDASLFGLAGTEDSAKLNDNKELLTKLSELRAIGAEVLGLAAAERADVESPAIPRVALVGIPSDYVAASLPVVATDYDIAARALSMGRVHHAFPGTGLLCLAAACEIVGTVPSRLSRPVSERVRIGHNKGVTSVEAHVTSDEGGVRVASASTFRTARRLLRGTAFID